MTRRTAKFGLQNFLVAATILFVATAAQTQQEPRPQQPTQQPQQLPPPGLQNPRGGPEVRRLSYFLGVWEEKVNYPGQAESEGRGQWFARPAMGLHVVFQYNGSGPQGDYRAMGVLAWDREAQQYRMLWFDDAGGIGDYRGNFTDPNTLVLEHRGKVDGREFRERITYTRVSPTQIKTKIEQAWESGEYKIYLEATANRTADQPPPPGQPPAKRPEANRPN
ncbi:MAG TPA: DUF1579 family protein [Candidatus Nitrosotenuis sp.]|nr:DUF1579 family protein [Candidatus Nitrosotenuis sp.]